ncbi:MAG: SPOR domain-containing protein [Spirochaetaceae bacterium]|jgi:DedD protein|nr:SPOR domain-containing protein [Spirochaetaceae bacterium]
MEKKKLLWTSIAVGFFLSMVIGAGILIMTPVRSNGRSGVPLANVQPVLSVTSPVTVDPGTMVKNTDGLQTLKPAATLSDAGTDAASGTDTNTDTNTNSDYHISADDSSTDGKIVINVSKPKPVAVEEKKPEKKPAAPPVVATAKPEGAAKPEVKKETVSSVAPRKAVPKANAWTAWWVQTGSYSNKSWAEESQKALSDKGITSVIETRDVEGKTWYRVRVGPYTSEEEAEFWKKLIVSIKGFENSQIWQNQIETASL